MESRESGSAALVAVPDSIEEFCPHCGEWVNYLNFNFDTGWCAECSGSIVSQPLCIHCGSVLLGSDTYRTTCRACRLELWLERYEDEIEYMMVVKGYSFSQARAVIIRIVRPICKACGKPIKGAAEGALFHKRNGNKKCHSAYLKFKQLQKSGLTYHEALATIRQN